MIPRLDANSGSKPQISIISPELTSFRNIYVSTCKHRHLKNLKGSNLDVRIYTASFDINDRNGDEWCNLAQLGSSAFA